MDDNEMRPFPSNCSIAAIPFTNIPVYIAVTAFAINAIVSVGLTLVFHAMKLKDGVDITTASDYGADENDPKVVKGAPAFEAVERETEPVA